MTRTDIGQWLRAVLAAVFLCTPAYAQDLVLSAPLDSGVYGASGGSVTARDGCTIASGKSVLLFASEAIVLADGFFAESGSTVSMRVGAFEGFSGTTDSDHDGLMDWQELVYFADLSPGAFDDTDGDGVNNHVEITLGTDPAHPGQTPGTGLYMTYDARGRLERAIRVTVP